LKTYRIDQSGITITSFINAKLPNESHIPFENIKSERFFYVQRSYQYLVGAGLFTLFFALSLGESLKTKSYSPAILVWGLPGIIFIVLFFALQPRVYFLKTFTGAYLKFKVSNNEAEIIAFVKNIIDKRNEYIRFKYGIPNVNIGYDQQYSNFNIMLREKIITADEFKEMVDKLNALFNQTAPDKTFLGYSHN